MRKWAAVIGAPIDHSLSPVLHRRAYELVGLDWEYRRYRVEAEQVTDFVADLDGNCAGLSVTMPCKQTLLAAADVVDGLAKAVGAANTLVQSGGLRAAFNTDVHGIVESLLRARNEELQESAARNRREKARAVILGTRATASSALAAVTTLGFEDVTVIGRNFSGPDTVTQAANRLKVQFRPVPWRLIDATVEAVDQADLVISTVPSHVSVSLLEGWQIRPSQQILDVTYADGLGPLADAFSAAGAHVSSPLVMLVAQGLAQVKLMSGLEAPFEPVLEAVEAAAERKS